MYFAPPRGGGKTATRNAPRAFLVFRVLLRHHFFYGHLPQTSAFRSAKQIFVANFHCTTWTRFSSGRNIFCTLRGRRTTAGYNAPGAFLVFFSWSLAPDLRLSLGQTNIRRKLPLNISIIFGRLLSNRQILV